ncbi:DUF1549 domain-containing protein [Rhodopirellula sp. P2]|uniref:DUF1549 domain-containing protein n=1 Tax=Rhodopirellula sp. P2 TaxID=2127060 RepID=UPI00236773E5|nr:DUF1549 domain-containing protein [Rhodopirellula sp. P2]WDQ18501.1 DUF1549 domain-containing protein [Rhodopirellula sp. P2]
MPRFPGPQEHTEELRSAGLHNQVDGEAWLKDFVVDIQPYPRVGKDSFRHLRPVNACPSLGRQNPSLSRVQRFTQLCIFCLTAWGSTTGGWSIAAPIDFETEIAPIFQQHCLHCHNETQKGGELSLSFAEGLMELGHVVPGDPQSSYLVETIHATDGETPSMPEEGTPLNDTQVDRVRRWIAEGAHWPNGFEIQHKAKADASWWSLQELADVSPPEPSAGQSSHPIDRFIQHRLAQAKIAPSPPAGRRTLIRRLSMDLIGLPPTPESVTAFVADPNPGCQSNCPRDLQCKQDAT